MIKQPLTIKPQVLARGFAPAKVNLTLHVTGQRADGYHLLDSLVMFASVGDKISMIEGPTGLTVTGPQSAGVPADTRNSILQAAQYMPAGQEAAFILHKELPAAAGIGGGTADAACALRLIRKVWPDSPASALFETPADAASLGADVPVSLASKTARMRGIGEQVELLHGLPPLHAVLVNPRVEVPTPAVFKTMTQKDNSTMDDLPSGDVVGWLARQRNDMQDAAIALAPVIAQVLDALKGSDLARMSGSGATCFGIYPDAAAAHGAAALIQDANPAWWIAPCVLGEPRDHIV